MPKFVVLETSFALNASTGCWEWIHGRSSAGYGQVRVQGVQSLAHRVFYKKYKGEIPKGMQLDHKCRVRHCVNPDHLEAVTSGENQRRGERSKLTFADIDGIRQLRASGWKVTQIAKNYRVGHSMISMILSGQRWNSR